MEAKRIQWIITGMQRDVSPSKFSPLHAFENYNLRLTAKEDNTLLSITNEKGTKQHNIQGISDSLIKGTYLGHAVLNKYLVIFTVNESSNIYRLEYDSDNNTFSGVLFFTDEDKSNKLNFDRYCPIETVTMYENEDIQKVYWTDGKNPPRFLNIVETNPLRLDANYFSFTPKIGLNENIEVVKNTTANGLFNPGTIQYAFTYFNRFGQETNIFYTSPLNYISYLDRGADVDSTVSNSFNIKLSNISTAFDYLRIYSILRTSVDTTPIVRKVHDIKINKRYGATISDGDTIQKDTKISELANPNTLYIIDNFGILKSLSEYSYTTSLVGRDYEHHYKVDLKSGDIFYSSLSGAYGYKVDTDQTVSFIYTIRYSGSTSFHIKTTTGTLTKGTYLIEELPYYSGTYTDNGTLGELIDPTLLLYIGGETFTAQTITLKDSTLFLGNILITRKNIIENIRLAIKGTLVEGKTIGYRRSTIKANPLPDSYTGSYPYKNQLLHSSKDIKTFKYLETYRLGVLFQHNTGKWSEVIFLGDFKNTVPIQTYTEGYGPMYTQLTKLIEAYYNLKNVDIINALIKDGYVKARPVVVYPDVPDREVICQGFLAPTVYNVLDRWSNAPFALSSWFTRVNSPFSYPHSGLNYTDFDNPGNTFSINSKAGWWINNYYINNGIHADGVTTGSYLEFRHNYPIPDNRNRNAEIQCIYNPPTNPYITETDTVDHVYIENNGEYFFVDQSILTFHSPDLEFDERLQALDSSNLKLRIVGLVPITSTSSDIDIITSTPTQEPNYTGFYKEKVGLDNISNLGSKGLSSGMFWIDRIRTEGISSDLPEGVFKRDSGKAPLGFMVYPWHRNGSLNSDFKTTDDTNRSAMLDKKKMSNLRYSYNSYYYPMDKLWEAEILGSSKNTGISKAVLFNDTNNSLIKIPEPLNSGLGDINYYGNIDKIINISKVGTKLNGYPIMVGQYDEIFPDSANSSIFRSPVTTVPYQDSEPYKQFWSSDPVRMKYKSTAHMVIALNYTSSGAQRILPTIFETASSLGGKLDVNPIDSNTHRPFWRKDSHKISQDVLDTPNLPGLSTTDNVGYGFLWLAELYNDNIQNKFGGTSEEVIQNNTWIPAGEPVSLIDINTGVAKSSVELVYSEGDTYYQRYDHLKTYPYTMEDQNSIVDIVSFMCETRVNIDGRYDRNRGQINNTLMSPLNFNKLNKAYSQPNNFFNYRAMDYNRLDLNKFPNAVTWSKQKYAGELIDTWTNLNLSSIIDMDGDKGEITALRRFNNEVYCFQDQGISRILFNSRVQIPTSDGVPVEISNSYKVDGKVYISETIGCTNKWSIVTTPFGLYFTDDITNSIQLFNGQELVNISDSYGFRTFLHDNSTSKKWNAETFENFISFYDKNNKDVYFVNDKYCLCYSELLKLFTSFYSYEATPLMVNMGKHMFNLKDNKLWQMNGGHYNHIYGKIRPYYTTLIANPDEPEDKLFSTVNYRADTYSTTGLLNNVTFDTFSIWNEYQSNTIKLTQTKGKPSNLKKKFRSWNITVPRDKSNKRDRIRNPWAYLKLGMENPGVYKTELHDIVLNYFI